MGRPRAIHDATRRPDLSGTLRNPATPQAAHRGCIVADARRTERRGRLSPHWFALGPSLDLCRYLFSREPHVFLPRACTSRSLPRTAWAPARAAMLLALRAERLPRASSADASDHGGGRPARGRLTKGGPRAVLSPAGARARLGEVIVPTVMPFDALLNAGPRYSQAPP